MADIAAHLRSSVSKDSFTLLCMAATHVTQQQVPSPKDQATAYTIARIRSLQ